MTNLKQLDKLRRKCKVPAWIVAAQFGVTSGTYNKWLNNTSGMDARYAEDGDRVEQRLQELYAGKVLPLLCCNLRLYERHRQMQELLKP